MKQTLPKPPIGDPCNGCGLCCLSQVCRNGAFILNLVKKLGDTVPGPCPALVQYPDGRMLCGIVLNPQKYIRRSRFRLDVLSREFAVLIGSGYGCDELQPNDTPEERAKLEKMMHFILNDPESVTQIRKALRIIHDIYV